MQSLINKVFNSGILREDDTSVIVYDLNQLDQKVNSVIDAFPKNTLHAVAIKANSLVNVLSRLANSGCGLEAASLQEVKLAELAGVPPNKIIFDSPAKTVSELKYALEKGMHINADSFQELDRIELLMRKIESNSNVGLRMNPQIGMGNIESTSVSGEISKFGVPVNSNRKKIISMYKKYKWLTGVHVHIGSQGYPMQKLVKGVKRIYDLANEINSEIQKDYRKLTFFDLGGGLPVKYHPEDEEVLVQDYVKMLSTEIPELFNGSLNIITEFGRYIHANVAFAISNVEYVKEESNINIIINHLGADFMLRKCYNSLDWHHEISVLDKNGLIRVDERKSSYSVAGPLCFSGDFIAKNILLPKVIQGDYLVIHDIGAYTLSMWSMYNSRLSPMVLGVDNGEVVTLRNRIGYSEILKFWK